MFFFRSFIFASQEIFLGEDGKLVLSRFTSVSVFLFLFSFLRIFQGLSLRRHPPRKGLEEKRHKPLSLMLWISATLKQKLDLKDTEYNFFHFDAYVSFSFLLRNESVLICKCTLTPCSYVLWGLLVSRHRSSFFAAA